MVLFTTHFIILTTFIFYLSSYNITHSLWEGSGEEAGPDAQKEIPPITAEETSTGASEGQQVETIYAPIPPETAIMLDDDDELFATSTGTTSTVAAAGTTTVQLVVDPPPATQPQVS